MFEWIKRKLNFTNDDSTKAVVTEKKSGEEIQKVPIADFFKDIEGDFTGAGHPATTRGWCRIRVGWPYYNGYTVIPDGMYPVIRVDGHVFHTFTKKMAKPFDENMRKAMHDATRSLIEFFPALYGYTQSDEITIVLPKESLDYGRKVHKLASLAAAVATASFIRSYEDSTGKKLSKLPAFDGRAFGIPDDDLVNYYQLWRERDATRNAISAVAQSLYSHKALLNKNSDEKLKMIEDKGIRFWSKYTAPQIVGFYFKRKLLRRKFTAEEIERLPALHEARRNPDLVVIRSEIAEFHVNLHAPNDLLKKDELPEIIIPNETSNTGDEI